MITTIKIGGTTYNAAGMIAQRFLGLNEMTISIDGYWSLNWTICGAGPLPTFVNGLLVQVFDGGTTLRFTGMLDRFDHAWTDQGWEFRIACVDLRRMLDRVVVRGSDGTGNAVYNRPPTDGALYIPSLSGLSCGAMIGLLLTISANANDLAGYGMNYASLSPPTLPTQTLTDLAALTVVPTRSVVFSGPSMIDACDQLIRYWMPRFSLWLQPDGTLRCTNLFTMSPNSLVVGAETGTTYDPVFDLNYTRDTEGCFTQIMATGINITTATLSELDGTLVRGWDPTLDAGWTILDFQQPANAYDFGTLSSVTTSSATVTSASATTHWATNFWTGNQGWIQLINLAANGIAFSDTRQITACAALTAGGSASVSWDAANPLTSTSYTTYVIRGTAGGESDVGRLWFVREPNGNLIGLNTWIGSHMVPQGPIPLPFSNNSVVFNTSTPVFFVQYSTSGSAPFIEVPLTAQVITQGTDGGGFRLTGPIWQATTTNAQLALGEPATPATGQYHDIIAMLFYNREDFVLYAPGPTGASYSGTAFTVDGIERYLPLPIADWTYAGLSANVQLYINEMLAVVQDAVITGEISHYGVPAGFDPLTLGYSLNITLAGQTGDLDAVNLPVRSVTLRWLPGGGPTNHLFTFHFSNQRRPFQGESLYIHPMQYGAGNMQGQMPFANAQIGSGAGPAFAPGTMLPTTGDGGEGMGGGGSMPSQDQLNQPTANMGPDRPGKPKQKSLRQKPFHHQDPARVESQDSLREKAGPPAPVVDPSDDGQATGGGAFGQGGVTPNATGGAFSQSGQQESYPATGGAFAGAPTAGQNPEDHPGSMLPTLGKSQGDQSEEGIAGGPSTSKGAFGGGSPTDTTETD